MGGGGVLHARRVEYGLRKRFGVLDYAPYSMFES
jgi:hypothetical protein